MKKSAAVPATVCALVAVALLEGCSSPTAIRRCVDPVSGQVLPDSYCGSGRSMMYMGRAVSGIWGYNGTMNRGRISGYSTSVPDNATVKSSSGSVISRGGFGGTGSSSSAVS
jgi:uncharacterized protein YgiB involved in biofilm formation